MNNKYLFGVMLMLLVGTAFASAITNSVHLTGQTVDGTGVVNGTFDGYFNISNVSDCSVTLDTDTTTIITDVNGRWSYYFDTSVVSSEQLWVGYTINASSPAYSETGCLRYSPIAYCEAWDPANDYYLNANNGVYLDKSGTKGILFNSTIGYLQTKGALSTYDGADETMNTDSLGFAIAADDLSYFSAGDIYGTSLWGIDDTGTMSLADSSTGLSAEVTYNSSGTPRVIVDKNLELEGTELYMGGESTIYGGPIGSDSITLQGSTVDNTPKLAIEGGSHIVGLLLDGSSEIFKIQDTAFTPNILFQVDEDGDAHINKDLYAGGILYGNGSGLTNVGGSPDRATDEWLYFDTPTNSKGIRYESANSAFRVGNYTDMLFDDDYGVAFGDDYDTVMYYDSAGSELVIDATNAVTDDVGIYAGNDIVLNPGDNIVLTPGTGDNTIIGDGGTTDYVEVADNGSITLYGNARVKKFLEYYPYNIGGISGTYNGVSCAASGLASLNGMYFKSYDDGQGAGQCEASNLQFVLPSDYEDGTNITITFAWTVGGTTGNVVWGAGYADVTNTDTFSPQTYTWMSSTEAVAGTAWERQDKSFEFDGTGLASRDILSIVVYRDADNGADTYSGDAYINAAGFEYTANVLGSTI